MASARAAHATLRNAVRRRALGAGGLAALSGAAVAACNAGGRGSVEGGTPIARSREPVAIEVLTRAGVSAPAGHSRFYDVQARRLFTPATDITVNLVDGLPNVGEKLSTLAAGGTLPDAAWFGVLADGLAGRRQAAGGVFTPLDELARRDARFDLRPYFPALLDAFSVGGRRYALPTHGHYGTNVLYYNKTLAQAAGVTVPANGGWTTDAFVAAARQMTRRAGASAADPASAQQSTRGDQDVWGWWPAWGFPEYGTFWVRQFGGEFLDAAGAALLLDTPEARTGLEFVRDAQARYGTIDDLAHPDPGAAPGMGAMAGLFALGQLAMHANTTGPVAVYAKPGQPARTDTGVEVGIAPMPAGPRGHRGTQASGSGMGLTGTAKRDAAWEWLKFVTSQENGVEQVFGGAGSPGGRMDVWSDPRLLTLDPIYGAMAQTFPRGPGSLRLPANHRYGELLAAVNTAVRPYFAGQLGLQDAAQQAVRAGHAVIQQ
jgi:ABC-type glycerol-3-phosphate transport system substrate-binding protein